MTINNLLGSIMHDLMQKWQKQPKRQVGTANLQQNPKAGWMNQAVSPESRAREPLALTPAQATLRKMVLDAGCLASF
ncbi:MAG TPA: hypothetical protein VGU67_04485 [Edaphobacter sp.]|nr:hypothetical protein [Edaphobacter sp.]